MIGKKVELRRALARKAIGTLLSVPARVQIMSWSAKERMPKEDELENRLVELLVFSPTVPINLDVFLLTTLLGEALSWRADKIKFIPVSGGYEAFFYRQTPKWLRRFITHYPWGGTKRFVAITRSTIELSEAE